jgi:hypothetical protein
VKECGARVILADVEGRLVSLNPVWMTVAVPQPDGGFVLVEGLQVHAETCVDIAARRRFGEQAGAPTPA